ncbi:hypothetical protein NQU49_10680, partial [Escherichia coli]|uniref:hypothetical protein n=1 Tax=Escherichia coli TaxID=562 RepID=UPI002117DA59
GCNPAYSKSIHTWLRFGEIMRGSLSALRPLLSRFLRRSLPQLVVLSNLELSDNRHIRMTATIGGK